jgi:uncharacterized protein YdhG (YjbR/CyaY superfamily)
MGERAKEVRAGKTDGESELLARIAEMSESDRVMVERLHAILKARGPALSPRTWYRMPAHGKDGKVVCFFRSAAKFKERYAMLGFNDSAKLDDGSVWPVAFARTERPRATRPGSARG